jgi:hypothetical protein
MILGTRKLTREDIPMLRERWKERIADLTGPIPLELPPLREVNHRIPLIDEKKVIRGRTPKCPEQLFPQLLEKIEKYTKAAWWVEANVESASPLLCVTKKSGLLRTVVDARERNANTVKDLTPFPDQDTIRNACARARFRTKLDMTDAYEQIRVEPEDVWKTAFATPVGTLLSNVMQQGDCNAPSTFQRIMSRTFIKQIGRFVYVYLDDIFIYSSSIEEHEEHLKIVFELLRKSRLYLSKNKVDLYSAKMECLGHIIDDDGIHVDMDKMRTIRDWPTPQNYNDIQRFVGLVNYVAQFMPDISSYTSPLTGMSSQATFTWNPIHQRCFDMIKMIACKAPILKPIDPEEIKNGKKIFLICDASPHGIGAYYGQGKDWQSCRPAGFLSKKFTNAQISYRTYEQETLAILEGLKKWEDKLLGRPFEILTDHKALQFFETQGSMSNRQIRWWEYISRFNASINYIEGSANKVADALSRYYSGHNEQAPFPMDILVTVDQVLDPEGDDLPVARFVEVKAARITRAKRPNRPEKKGNETLPEEVTPEKEVVTIWEAGSPDHPLKINLGDESMTSAIREGYEEDTVFKKVMENITQHPAYRIRKGILYLDNPIGQSVICVPAATKGGRRIIELIIDQSHTLVGHQGYRKVVDYVRRWFWWPTMSKDIKKFCDSCGRCQTTKASTTRPMGLLHSLPIPTRPWSSIAMDFVGPFPKSKGFDFLMVILDRLSSMVHLIPTNTTATALDIAWLWLDNIVRLHGLPDTMVSDRDPRFISRFWTELHRLIGIKLLKSTAYHPQTDGASERAVRTVSQILRAVVSADQTDWAVRIPMVEFAMNSAVSATTGFAPFEVNYGWTPNMITKINIKDVKFRGVQQFAERALETIDAAHDAIIASRVIQTHNANKSRREDPPLAVGDLVYLSTADLSLPKGRANKLLPKFIGPYPIVKADPATSNYTLTLPPELVNRRIHPKFHISRLRPHIRNDDERFPNREVHTYYDFGENPETEWYVDSIIGHQWTRNKLSLHVKWRLGDVTWEPVNNCEKLEALDDYLTLHGVKTPEELPRKVN